MRISELQNKLAEIQGEFGNCHVIIDDKAQPEFRVITNFSVEEALVKDKSGDIHEVVSLVIPAEKAVDEEREENQKQNNLPGYFRDLKLFHFLLIKQMRTMADMCEAHLSQMESSIDKLKKNSQ